MRALSLARSLSRSLSRALSLSGNKSRENMAKSVKDLKRDVDKTRRKYYEEQAGVAELQVSVPQCEKERVTMSGEGF